MSDSDHERGTGSSWQGVKQLRTAQKGRSPFFGTLNERIPPHPNLRPFWTYIGGIRGSGKQLLAQFCTFRHMDLKIWRIQEF